MTRFYLLTFVPFITRRYEVADSFVIEHKLHNGIITAEQTKAIEELNKPWIVPELVRNPFRLH